MINKYYKGAAIQIARVFRRCLCKDPLKHGFLDIYLTIFFGAGISGNTSAMDVIFIWQMFKIEEITFKIKKKSRKSFLFFR